MAGPEGVSSREPRPVPEGGLERAVRHGVRSGPRPTAGAGGRALCAAAVGAALMMLAGCGASGTPAAKPAAPAAPQPTTAATTGQASQQPAPAPAQRATVRIAIPAKGVAYLNLFVGRDLGIYKKHGVNVRLIDMHPAASLPALEKGQIDFVTEVASAARLAERGQPIRVVYIGADHDDFVLVGARGVTKVSQLRGKVVGGATPRSELSVMAERLLAADGLPAGAYHMLYVGGGAASMAALSKGEVAAAMMDVSNAVRMHDQGYPIIDSSNRFLLPAHGFATSLAQIQHRGALLRRALAATMEATRLVTTDRSRVLPVMEKEFHLDAKDATQVYDQLKPTWVLSGRPSQQAIANELAADQKILKLRTRPDVSSVYDFSLLPASGGGASGG